MYIFLGVVAVGVLLFIVALARSQRKCCEPLDLGEKEVTPEPTPEVVITPKKTVKAKKTVKKVKKTK